MTHAIYRVILALCAAAVLACSGGGAKGGTSPSGGVSGYTATRWVPGNASYLVTARSAREAQQGVRDLVETFGVLVDVELDDLSRELTKELRVDLLSPEAVADIGIDLEGGFALFSEHYNPTLVARLASPPAFRAFLERQQLQMQSVVVDGVEVFTAPLPGRLRISWAVAEDWLWVHFLLPDMPDDSATWFTSSRKPTAPAWAAELAGANAPVAGFVDAARFVADIGRRVPEVGACFQALEVGALGKLTLAIAGDPKQASARVTLDVGTLAARIAASVLPIPEGFAAATAQVPIAGQMNVDLAAVRTKIAPCLQLVRADLRDLEQLGIRAGRGYLRSFDADAREGTGAISLDLTHKAYFAAQLDRIPGFLHRKRTFGAYAGRSVSIPMFLTVDYVLQDHLALAAVGDGQLLTMIGRGGSVPGPLFEVAVQPLGLSIASWTELFQLLDIDDAKRVAERLHRWQQARVNLTIEGSRLVLAATGTRR